MKITLANLEEATEQQVYDQVKDCMLSQTEPCENLYRDANFKPVGVGCLIANEEFLLYFFEWADWFSLSSSGKVPDKHAALIYAMQRIYIKKGRGSWVESLHELASKAGLNP